MVRANSHIHQIRVPLLAQHRPATKVQNEAATRALCVPKPSSTSCDQAVFVDQAAAMSLFSDTVTC